MSKSANPVNDFWRTPLWQLVAMAPLILLASCASLERMLQDTPPTLAELEPVALAEQAETLPVLSADALESMYLSVLQHPQNDQTQIVVRHRLADLEMQRAQEKLALADDEQPSFHNAIASYTALVHAYPQYPHRDRLLYQLAKAYDLSGDSEASHSVLAQLSREEHGSGQLTEVYFRRAERDFTAGRYAQAEQAYAQVLAAGETTAFYTRALYMRGWSVFKQAHYESAVPAFLATLDYLLPTQGAIDTLSRADHEIAQDSLRVLALSISYLGGVAVLDAAAATQRERPYQHLIYQALGQLYLEQERYADSAQAYRSYTYRYPASGYAHNFTLAVIEVYERGGLVEKSLAAKDEYVHAFQLDGDYWQNSPPQVQDDIAVRLREFLDELATLAHEQAQLPYDKGSPRSDSAPDLYRDEQARNYQRAANYYQQYLHSFPLDPKAPRIALLLGDCRFELGDFAAAVDAYDIAAYHYPDSAGAADAAYAAIIAYDTWSAQPPIGGADSRIRERIEAQLRFANHFPNDTRANAALANAAGELFELGDYAAAMAAAGQLIQTQPLPAAELLIPAWLISGHSLLKLTQYASAEEHFSKAIALMSPADPRRHSAQNQLATAIYQQGAAALESKDTLAAAAHFERVVADAPQSDARVTAQYDAALVYTQMGELQQANALLIALREDSPAHELAQRVPQLLITNYESQEQWLQAAHELERLASSDAGPETARQAQLLAARYYVKARATDKAINSYQRYASQWELPLGDYLEALHELSLLMDEAQQPDAAGEWRRRLVSAHDNAGPLQSARSRYLAASAACSLAENERQAFIAITLQLPLQDSLQRKRSAMTRALQGFKQCQGYGIEDFNSLALFRLGEIHQQISIALAQSPRPAGLDALALEQYELLLEEQTFPFEDKAIAIHQSNIANVSLGVYDKWVERSYAALSSLLPARYGKRESVGLPNVASGNEVTVGRVSQRLLRINTAAIELRKSGQFQRAERAYLDALQVDADHAPTHRNLGILYDLYLAQPDKALAHYARYQALLGNDDRTVLGWISDLQQRNTQHSGVL
jgi:tetratricopeptide (TPR) repeat protein